MARGLHRFDTAEQELEVGGRRIRLLRPRAPDDLLERAAGDGVADAPYWAELWPSALVLAAELAGRDLRGVRSVELGCGLGLPSIAAALAGATALATDVDRDALAFAAENGRRALGRRLETLRVDLLDPPGALLRRAPFDLVLAADVLYREELATGLATLVPRITARDGRVLVAVPWRAQERPLVAALAAAGWDHALVRRPSPTARPGSSAGLLTLTPPRAAARGCCA